MPRRVRREVLEWVLALHPPVGQEEGAVRAEDDGPACARTHQDPADMRMLAERRNETRMALLDLLERQPAGFCHQVDKAEIARAEHDDLLARDVFLRTLLRFLAGGLAERVPDHRLLLVAACNLLHSPALERAFHQVVEPIAVPLLERRTLRLAVI